MDQSSQTIACTETSTGQPAATPLGLNPHQHEGTAKTRSVTAEQRLPVAAEDAWAGYVSRT